MTHKEVNRTRGSTLRGTLLVVFIVLKLFGVSTWSWWWVFSPVWIPLVVLFVVCALIAVMSD
jgi:hypothetical protein